MTLVLELETQEESALHRRAAQLGLTLEDYAHRLLAECLVQTEPAPQEKGVPFYHTATTDEWERRFDAWADRHRHLPRLRPEAYGRASFYGERG